MMFLSIPKPLLKEGVPLHAEGSGPGTGQLQLQLGNTASLLS